jgi:hypothetical protein
MQERDCIFYELTNVKLFSLTSRHFLKYFSKEIHTYCNQIQIDVKYEVCLLGLSDKKSKFQFEEIKRRLKSGNSCHYSV